MVITLGQQCNVGEKPTVILYTYINRRAGTPTVVPGGSGELISLSIGKIPRNAAAVAAAAAIVYQYKYKYWYY